MQADASLEMERKHFYQESMKYVLLLQAVQERKKFEFVEIVCNLITASYFLYTRDVITSLDSGNGSNLNG